MITRGVEWGPVGTWAGAIATVLVLITTALVALGYFDGFPGSAAAAHLRGHRTLVPSGQDRGDGTALWVRVGVENLGASPARGCLGRLISVTTNGELRPDVDPVQLRWAGVPRSRAFDPMDLRRDQREYLNVLCLADGSRWRLVTFEDPDFDPGFATDLPLDQPHVLRFSVFSDNAHTVTRSLVAEVGSGDREVKLQLK
jgi:hypothetical protein